MLLFLGPEKYIRCKIIPMENISLAQVTFLGARITSAGGPACTHHRWIRAPPPQRAGDLDAFFKEIEEPDYDWVELPSGRYVQ
jgi:hypothetical protein